MTNRIFLLLACTAVIGCSGKGTQSEDPSPDGPTFVVRGAEMSGNVLEGLRVRVPGLSVDTRTGNCPALLFRGQRSMRNQRNPTVYIDGTMMVDTCMLQQISAQEVDRVEIYPSGNISKPGIQRNPFGIIVVYRINR